jgi:hypothetical protein
MKKALLVLGLVVCGMLCARGQVAGEWTWMNGDTVSQSLAHYGTQGEFDSLNTPPALYETCEWTDKDGNFWLYGGVLFGPSFGGPSMSDLWKFNPAINQWAWIKGPGGTPNQTAIYGVQGIPSPNNTPGSRGWGTPTWVDTTGNLWLFGGYSAGNYKNDLWKYNISSNEWTWMKGPDTLVAFGNYGTMGLPDSANVPSPRCETNASWTDDNNNLWLFGGMGNGSYNDLWRYNISTNIWTWMKGSSTPNFDHGVYGIKGVSDSANRPSMRYCYAKWKDENNNLWFYGGYEQNTPFYGIKNDVWRYSITSNEWTWISGDSIVQDSIATENGQCVATEYNLPACRYENRACWQIGDNFLVLGGLPLNGRGFNDLWSYNVLLNEWTWVSGATTPNPNYHYGIKTISNPLNSPPGRFGSIGWRDNQCNLWFFGGVYYDFSLGSYICLNDMWRYTLDSTCIQFTSCSGLNNIDLKSMESVDVRIYPNPTTGTFTITLNGSTSSPTNQLQITDLAGRVVHQQTLTQKSEVINQNFSAGVYFVRVGDGERSFTEKLIIQ